MAELDATIHPDELTEWQAFYELYPWDVADEHFETLAQLIYRANWTTASPITFFDRDYRETARLSAQADAAISLDDKIERYFATVEIVHTISEIDNAP